MTASSKDAAFQNLTRHLKAIFEEGEQSEEATVPRAWSAIVSALRRQLSRTDNKRLFESFIFTRRAHVE